MAAALTKTTMSAMQLERAHVEEVMHRGVVSCDAAVSMLTVARIMAAHRVHSVVVRAADALPTMITDREVATAVYEGAFAARSAAELAYPAPLVRPDDSLTFALERMHESASTHAVVVGRSLRLLGIVSILDVIEALLRGRDRMPAKAP
jgi:CBS domain-containing protein